jgi:L-rhamnono-1,4-lactonase
MPPEDLDASHDFQQWRENIFSLSMQSKTYMKLSGCFSELPPALQAAPAVDIFKAIQPWLIVILTVFKPARIMFGSDWPVCTVGVGDGEDGAWAKWKEVVEIMCSVAGLTKEEQIMIWSGTAIKAYNIEELMSW